MNAQTLIALTLSAALLPTACRTVPREVSARMSANDPHAYYQAAEHVKKIKIVPGLLAFPLVPIVAVAGVLTLGQYNPTVFVDENSKTDAAERYYTKGAELGDADCQYALGLIYKNGGFNLHKNAKLAAQNFAKAAVQGHAPAIGALAECYLTGSGVAYDPAKARELFAIAKRSGLSSADNSLARADSALARDAQMRKSKQIIQAINDNNIAGVREIIRSGCDVNFATAPMPDMSAMVRTTSSHISGIPAPLAYAAALGRTEIASILIQAGANVNQADRFYQTPVEFAATNGHSATLAVLLRAGANPNGCYAPNRWKPIQRAARYNRSECVRLLIAAGANPNEHHYGVTPYQIARGNGGIATCQVLLSMGAVP